MATTCQAVRRRQLGLTYGGVIRPTVHVSHVRARPKWCVLECSAGANCAPTAASQAATKPHQPLLQHKTSCHSPPAATTATLVWDVRFYSSPLLGCKRLRVSPGFWGRARCLQQTQAHRGVSRQKAGTDVVLLGRSEPLGDNIVKVRAALAAAPGSVLRAPREGRPLRLPTSGWGRWRGGARPAGGDGAAFGFQVPRGRGAASTARDRCKGSKQAHGHDVMRARTPAAWVVTHCFLLRTRGGVGATLGARARPKKTAAYRQTETET